MLGYHPYFDTGYNWEGWVVSYKRRPHFTQENFLAVTSVRGWVKPRATECERKEEVTWKFPRTLQGIEPETSSLVA